MLNPLQFFLWMAKKKMSVFEKGNKLNLFLLHLKLLCEEKKPLVSSQGISQMATYLI